MACKWPRHRIEPEWVGMATVYINDKAVDIGDKRLNLVQVAELAGVTIPHYCYHPALSVVASCRMCLVELGEKTPDGSVQMQPRVVPACQTPAKDGAVVQTATSKSKTAQGQTLEALLLNHPLDCPVCDKAGECKLQDYSYQFGFAESRMVDEKNTPPNKPDLGPNINLFTDRCIMCSRCVRFTREISGTSELHIVNRGTHSEIDVFPGDPLNNKLATNVVDLCPVGALASKDFLYSHRVWNLKTVDSVCPGCSTGCSIHIDANKDVVYRLRPRENPLAQGYFMCDDGRLGYHYANSKNRLSAPKIRSGQEWKETGWKEIVSGIDNDLRAVAAVNPKGILGVLSPFLTVEEGFLLAQYLKSLSKDARLALGPIPVTGEDDNYPKTRNGQPAKVQFTIRQEKCPNRKGIEAILQHFEGKIVHLRDSLQGEKAEAVFLTGGYPPSTQSWLEPNLAKGISKTPLIINQDLFENAVAGQSKYLLPAAAFAEKEGTFVNHAGLAQGIKRICSGPRKGRTDGQVYLDLLGRKGLLHAFSLHKEIASAVPCFAPLLTMGPQGVNLEKGS